eukprot:scaffold306_cov525-Prasinococcus_capsulatus_cf.AAC.47
MASEWNGVVAAAAELTGRRPATGWGRRVELAHSRVASQRLVAPGALRPACSSDMAEHSEETPSAEATTDAIMGAIDKASAKERIGELPAQATDVQEALKQLMIAEQRKRTMQLQNANPETKDYHFWKTQPVPQFTQGDEGAEVPGIAPAPKGQPQQVLLGCLDTDGPIDEPKTVADVKKDPYKLPTGFQWCECDVTDDGVLQEVYTLLNENYVEDNDAMFRFDYSPEFLRWALQPPEYDQTWHIGVRVTKTNKLMALITGIPAQIDVNENKFAITEINFLCVHKKLRSKRLAPVLIKEVTRRVNLRNIWQACYTAGVVLPRPVAVAQYYHRTINPKKLIDVGESRNRMNPTMLG